jgi:hypothetical protein
MRPAGKRGVCGGVFDTVNTTTRNYSRSGCTLLIRIRAGWVLRDDGDRGSVPAQKYGKGVDRSAGMLHSPWLANGMWFQTCMMCCNPQTGRNGCDVCRVGAPLLARSRRGQQKCNNRSLL